MIISDQRALQYVVELDALLLALRTAGFGLVAVVKVDEAELVAAPPDVPELNVAVNYARLVHRLVKLPDLRPG